MQICVQQKQLLRLTMKKLCQVHQKKRSQNSWRQWSLSLQTKIGLKRSKNYPHSECAIFATHAITSGRGCAATCTARHSICLTHMLGKNWLPGASMSMGQSGAHMTGRSMLMTASSAASLPKHFSLASRSTHRSWRRPCCPLHKWRGQPPSLLILSSSKISIVERSMSIHHLCLPWRQCQMSTSRPSWRAPRRRHRRESNAYFPCMQQSRRKNKRAFGWGQRFQWLAWPMTNRAGWMKGSGRQLKLLLGTGSDCLSTGSISSAEKGACCCCSLRYKTSEEVL